MEQHTMKVIARIRSDFPEKFGIPRQSGLVPELRSKIVFEPEFRNADALRGIEGFSHLWLIWQFSAAVRDTWSPTVRRGLAATNASACSPRAHRFARTPSAFPASSWRVCSTRTGLAMFCLSQAPT